jgi:hypothetical protein
MSDCLHCDIHELLERKLQSQEVNLAEIATNVAEVLTRPPQLAPLTGRSNGRIWT